MAFKINTYEPYNIIITQWGHGEDHHETTNNKVMVAGAPRNSSINYWLTTPHRVRHNYAEDK